MRAVVFTGPGRPVEVREVDLAAPREGEVLVRIAGAGVCHSDLHVWKGEWPRQVPVVLGHEGSGEVVDVGPGVTGLRPGDHVVLSWIAPCGECRWCRAGHEARCTFAAEVVGPQGVLFDGTTRLSMDGEPVRHYLGVSSWAEYAVVPASGAIKVRDDAPLDVIALVGCAVATGVGAVLNTAKVEVGSTVVVIGCGGVGLSIVQGARLAGASRIVAVDLVAAKTGIALAVGATDAVDGSAYDAVDAVRDLLPEGADYAFDGIGHTATTEQAIRMLGLGGAAVLVGLPPSGARASFEPLVLTELDGRILGSNYGSIRPARDLPWLVDRYVEGDLMLDELVTARRPLEAAGDALEQLATGQVLRTLLVP
ncbi:MAG TPA: Zn-dependent alcohol dehydrogenase [Candidatus Nanopelagicales bacterium]|nr:Zn-dependent alcohol dehydrogenase [Candidatus Nanopelagicales bacterium]